MRTLTSALFICFSAFLLPACGSAEEESSTEATAVCCGGACDAPEGTCCSDGTCHGNHAELPLAPKAE
ncbi:MAG TPA: hypothetical protein QGG59_09775 [Planctomycetota bacterium]|nr:hypothetical protein [Planctomycetota bacterium]MDP7245252.1 hypothetical protein [Planctomycetota bacterium]HJM40393.1 hypothetical protein [Planctomycetota bacterium]